MTSDPCSQVGASRERTTNGQTSSANELEDTSAISRGSASRIAKTLPRRHPQAGGAAGPGSVDLARRSETACLNGGTSDMTVNVDSK